MTIYAADRVGKARAMIDNLNWTATIVFVFFFALVTVIGFMAARWKAGDLDHLTSGVSAGGASAPGSPGSCSAAISIPPIR